MTFADIGSHWCDLIEFVTGHHISAVFAMEAATPRRGVRQDDGAVVAFRTDRGAVGSVVVSQASPGRNNQLSFSADGRETAVQFNQERPDELIIGGLHANTVLSRSQDGLDPRSERYSLSCPPVTRRDTRTASTCSSPTYTKLSAPVLRPKGCRCSLTVCGLR